MIKVALVGAGKMGLSHLSILGARHDVEIVGICDTSKLVLSVLEKYSKFSGFTDFVKMLDETKPDAVFIAVPTKFHYSFIKESLLRNIHVFAEKPFCLDEREGKELVQLVDGKNLINQVGYHNKFVGTFQEVKRLLKANAIGDIHHFHGEAYGPVVLKKKDNTWRSNSSEGGGCLMDYASHVIDLINHLISPVISSKGGLLKSLYSREVDDAVYALLELENKTSGVLSVNWSDETYRKMSTSITINGSAGKIVSDANELKVYFKNKKCPEGYSRGWNVKYVTDLTTPVNFYLRGEEYSAQIDYFLDSIKGIVPNSINTFESAWLTDRAINIIKEKVYQEVEYA